MEKNQKEMKVHVFRLHKELNLKAETVIGELRNLVFKREFDKMTK